MLVAGDDVDVDDDAGVDRSMMMMMRGMVDFGGVVALFYVWVGLVSGGMRGGSSATTTTP